LTQKAPVIASLTGAFYCGLEVLRTREECNGNLLKEIFYSVDNFSQGIAFPDYATFAQIAHSCSVLIAPPYSAPHPFVPLGLDNVRYEP
jgi:hypothetical protein